jgi:hypothetical protein
MNPSTNLEKLQFFHKSTSLNKLGDKKYKNFMYFKLPNQPKSHKDTLQRALTARPEICFTDLDLTYFNLDFSAFHISALA